MTDNDKLKTMKLLAKRYARTTAQPQHVALDFVATRLGFSHWNALRGSAKGEWVPSEAQVAEMRIQRYRTKTSGNKGMDSAVGSRIEENTGRLRRCSRPATRVEIQSVGTVPA